MAEGQVQNIPERSLTWFKEQLAKLSKKSEKFSGEKIFCTVVGFHREEDRTSKLFGEKIFEVFVSMPDVKLNGWEFIATVDHMNEEGNLVRVVPGKTLPKRHRTSEPVCEHCGYNRKRRATVVVQHEHSQETKQVGSSCLKDFLGHGDADRWAKLAELKALVGDYIHASYSYDIEEGHGMRDTRWMLVKEFAAHTATIVRTHGWVSRGVSKLNGRIPTVELAWDSYNVWTSPSAEDHKVAEDALEWATNFEGELSDWQHNSRVIALSGVMEPRNAGIVASIVGVYYTKVLNPIEKQAQQPSEYQDKVGARIEREVTLKGRYPGEFTTRYVMADDMGNVYVWFTNVRVKTQVGDKMKMSATVKAHNLFKGVKQNIVSHLKEL